MFKSFRFLVPGIVFIFSLPRFVKAQIDFEVPYPPDVEYYQEAPSASSQTLHVVGCNFTIFGVAGGSGLYMDIDDFNTSYEGDIANTRYLYGAMYDASPVSRMEITNDDGGTFDLHSIAVGTWPAGSTPWNTDQAVTIQGYRSGTAVTGVITEYVHYVGAGGYVQPANFDVSADASFQGIDKIVISSPGIDLAEIEVDNINGVNLGDVVSAPVITPDANGVIYVDHSVSATGNGSSWTNAMKELGDALDSAASLNAAVAGTVKEIWVAKGTYKPTRIAGPDDGGGSTTSRDMAFVLVKDVKVYGGFSGTEASLDDRDLAKIHTDNETILSGDIGTSGDINDNVYHVVISTGAVGSALIDGFTVTAGNADGAEGFTNKIKINGEDIYRSVGGGMGLVNSSPNISNMIFTGNQANIDGGGMEIFHLSNPTLSNITFRNNTVTKFGGGVAVVDGSPELSGIIFTANTAGKSGGGLYNGGVRNPTLANCVFNANHATENGGGIFNISTNSLDFTNLTFYNNSADQNGGAFSNETTAAPGLINSILWGNTAATDPQIHYTDGAPVVSNSIVQGGYAGGTGITDSDPLFNNPATGDLTLQANSPAVNAGNNGAVSAISWDSLDLAGNARIYHGDEGGVVDLGAYESSYSFPATVTTATAADITATGATLGGGITSNGAGTITDYGIVWSLAQDPTTSDHKVSMGTTETPTFSETVSGLPAGVLIHYRAYAVNEAGAAYGSDKTLSIPVAGFIDALHFDGTDDYVSIPDDPSLRPDDSITLSAWIRPETGGEAYGFVMGKEGPGKDYLLAITSDGAIHGRFHVTGGTSPEGNWPYYQTADAVIAFNQWQYVSVTYDNQTVKVYVNGILQQSFAWNWPLDLAASGTPLTIGVRGADKTLHFKGKMDEPQVWSKALDADEIRAAMYKTLNGNETGLAGYWKFNEGAGTTAYDNSPEGNNGTLVNAPQYITSTIRDFSTNEDMAYSSILAGSDASGAVLSYSVVTNGTKGTASINAATGAFTYTPNADETGSDTFTFRSADNSNTETVHVTINPVNDAPEVTATAGNATFAANNIITSTPVVIDSGITVSDKDNITLMSATISITGNHENADSLAFTNDGSSMGSITAGAYDAANGTLTLTSLTATCAQWQAALRAVTYGSRSVPPGTADRTITFKVYDGTDSSVAATKTIDIVPLTLNASAILYVNNSVSGGDGSGDNWTNAIKELGDALAVADSLKGTTPVKEIWVARGTYKPTRIPGDGHTVRDKTFVLVKDVKVYGGFAGTEASTDDRDSAKIHTDNETILSGDIGTSGDPGDNVYHVIIAASNIGTALLDGFTVTGGNADAVESFGNKVNVNGVSIYQSGGGGMALEQSGFSPTVSHVIFTGNSANADGAGMELDNNSFPTLSDIIFEENAATQYGGGLSLINSGFANISGIIFTRNTAGKSGGGLYLSGSSPSFINCVFNANHASENGGGIFNSNGGNPTFTNFTFYNNSAVQSGGAFSHEMTSTPRLRNSILWGNTAATDPQVHYTDGAPVVSNSIVQGGYAGATGITDSDPLFNDPAHDDLTLQANSPAINAGNNSAVSAISLDLAGNARIYHRDEGGVVDLGAYESPYSLPATVTTATAADITATGATLGGGITSNGGGTITDYGIVWSLAQDPTTSDHKVSMGTTEAPTFSETVSGLPAGVLVHYRAYAVNEAGAAYGSDKTLSIPAAGFISALQFNGSDNRVEAPAAAGALGTGDFTITAWVKYPQTGGGTFISNRTSGSDEAPFFSLMGHRNSVTETGKLIAEVCAGPGTDKGLETDVPGIDDNSWHHIVFERSGTQYTLYVDGKNVYEETAAALNLNSGDPLVIGGRYNGTDFIEDFSGQLDEVSVWNRALSAAGRDSSMYKTFNGNEPGLLGYWKFNENTGTTAYDNSPNGYDGVLTNMDAAADGVVSTIRDFSTDEDSSYLSVLPASDAAGDALTYSLVTNGTKGTVTITNTSTGAFTYTPDADVNGTDSFTYKVSDGTSNSNTATVNVTINPVNDAPEVTATTGNTAFTEGDNITSAPVVIDGGITLSDADNTTLTSATVSITGNFHGSEDTLLFNADAGAMGNITGSYNAAHDTLTLISPDSTATLAQWEAALQSVAYTNLSETPDTSPRTISFAINDGSVNSASATKMVTVAAVDDAPVITSNGGADADSVSVTENATTVTTVTATDRDNALTYSISGTDAGDFNIDEASGALTFNPAPDFESPADADADNTYEVTVHASDGTKTDDQVITVTVTDINDVTPVITPSQSFTVDENSADGTAVGTVAGSDGDVMPTTFGNWTIVSGNTNDAFKIDGAMGAITVNKPSQLDYETTKHYTLALTVSDGIHTSAPENVVINLNDLNDVTPVITPSQSFTVDENSAGGTAVGTVTVSDGDVTPATFGSWTIVSGNTNDAFKIDTTTGAITVNNGPALDFETQSSYTLTLTVSDGIHTSEEQTVAVRLNNQAEAPTGIGFVQDPLYENRPAGTLAGRFSATAQDAGAMFTYTLATGEGDADNSLFNISGDALKTTAAFNYEQKNSYSIRVRSTTQYGQSLEKAFTIRISDVNEAPALDAIADQTICYTTAQQSVNLSGISAGEDGGQTTSLSVSSDNAALFESLTVSGNKLKYRISDAGGVTTSGTVLVTVTVTDDGGTENDGANTFSRSFTLTVNPLPVPVITSDIGTGLSKGIAAHLTATGGATYQWAAAGGILSGLQNQVLTVRPVQNTTYRVTVTSDKGCIADEEIALNVKDDYAALSANNIFTPNGDGRNDTWKIVNLDVYKNNEIFIYDRSGRLIFHKKNYQNDWNGMLDGRPLHTGTYYYIVNVESGKKIFKGFITIIRNE